MALDDAFERLLAETSEAVAVAAVGSLAQSVGRPAADRLSQIAATDTRANVKAAAKEGLASIGSEQSLPYLREKLNDASRHGEAVFQLARLRYPEAEWLLADAAKANRDDFAQYRLYLPALAISGGAAAVQAIYEILGPQPDDLTLSYVRGQLAPDTTARAQAVWTRLAAASTPAWRMAAAAVLVQDPSQILIDRVIHMAVEDEDWTVRAFARRALRWGAPAITSEPIAEYLLTHLQRQVTRLGRPDVFLLELTWRYLRGLAQHDQALPPGLAHRVLAVLRQILSITHAHPTDEHFGPLMTALALPDFSEAAADLERLLDEAPDADTQGQVLDTLAAMRPPKLLNVLIRVARTSRWPALREKAENYLAALADVASLLRLPKNLGDVAYGAAIVRDVRCQRKGLRQIVILANGHAEILPPNR